MSYFQLDENHKQFLAATSFSDEGVGMALMTAEGIPLYELEYLVSGEIKAQELIPGIQLKPEYIFLDMQLTLWPIESLNRSLSGAIAQDYEFGRKILKGSELLVNIETMEKGYRFENIKRGYTIIIQEMHQ